MIWSKIKRAINSTIGTSEFKPLDKIVIDSFSKVIQSLNEIKNKLTSGKNEYIVSKSKISEFATTVLLPNEQKDGSVIDLGEDMQYGIYVVTLQSRTYDYHGNLAATYNQGTSIINLSKKMVDLQKNTDYPHDYNKYNYILGSDCAVQYVESGKYEGDVRCFAHARFKDNKLSCESFFGSVGVFTGVPVVAIVSITILPTED